MTHVSFSQQGSSSLSRGLRDKVIGCLATQYTATPAAVHQALPVEVQQWAKVRIIGSGDTIQSSVLDTGSEGDGQNASYVRVSGTSITKLPCS